VDVISPGRAVLPDGPMRRSRGIKNDGAENGSGKRSGRFRGKIKNREIDPLYKLLREGRKDNPRTINPDGKKD
jgi:hypothetical protein